MADQTKTGRITEYFEREWKDRNTGRDIILRSLKIDSANQFFRTGTTDLSGQYPVGTGIKFVHDAKGNIDLDTVSEVEVEASSPPPKKAYSKGGGNQRNDYWEQKAVRDIEITEPRISYSAAQRNATTLVAAALEADILSFGQAAKGKKLDMLVDFVEQTTLRLAQLQMNAPEIMKEIE